mmetsp:Transcript_15290/g.36694  ORF Transcript_15290/g.36694 Transcript_15290/m.36694 type:complete len:270 (+) Transcript_15290:525-1334(+)
MSQQSRTLGIFPHPIHICSLQLYTRPRLHQLPQTGLPSPFEVPRNLNEIHVRFPIIHEHSLVPSPFLKPLVGRVAIVVVVRSEARVQIIGQAALVESQCAERPFDYQMPPPLVHHGGPHFIFDSLSGHVGLLVPPDAHDAVIGHVKFVQHFIVQWIIVRLTIVELKHVPHEGGDEGCFVLAMAEFLIESPFPRPFVDPVNFDGVRMITDESVLHLAAGIRRQELHHIVHADVFALVVHLPILPIPMREGPGHHAPEGALLEAHRQTIEK